MLDWTSNHSIWEHPNRVIFPSRHLRSSCSLLQTVIRIWARRSYDFRTVGVRLFSQRVRYSPVLGFIDLRSCRTDGFPLHILQVCLISQSRFVHTMNRHKKPPWPGDHRRLAHKLKLELKIWIQDIVLLDMAGIRYDNDDFVRTIVLVCGGSIWQQGSIQNHGKYLYVSLSSLGDSVSPKNEKWEESRNGQDEGNSVLKQRPMIILQHQHNVEYFSYCVCWFQIGRKPRSWRVKTITTHVISCSGSVWDGLRCNRWIQSNDLRKEKRLLVTMHDSQKQYHLRPRTKMDKVSVSAYSTDELDSNVLLLFQFQNLLKNVLFISYVSCKHLNSV
ncbi:BnaA07g01270D [Brassica napus]|uniref:(rape) hypothetical protein n=1 Tax=Brassica napus TaxID=3708 RepID=A0A078HNF6_BRANA|nr:unnamed protein product [Brassica napus]CDY39131.1 BnaA07g01270D [Brassica napus]